ncbi:MAG: prolyl oligopeptidase family serine peptidase [Blastocatellia bacterium]
MKRVYAPMIIALALACASPINSAAQQQPDGAQQTSPPGKPMPFDLAFHRRELADIAISPDGKLVAYAVHTPPAKSSGGGYYLPNGVPGIIPDRIIFISEVATGKQWQAGPAGSNSWRPVFSDDGLRLAFYCDKGNAPHLWVYDIARRSGRQLGTAVVKPQVWQGDEPEWGADGKEIFVPLAPPKTAANTPESVVKAGSGDENKPQGLSVTVRRAGAEEPKVTEDKKAVVPGPNPLWKEFHTVLAAINVKTGTVRSLVPTDATPPPNILDVSPSGKWVVYVSVVHQPAPQVMSLLQDLAVVPAGGGTAQIIAADLPARPGNLRGTFAWHPTRDQVFWFKDGKLWTADLATQPVTPRQVAPTLVVPPGLLSFTRDGSAILIGALAPDNPKTQVQAIVPLNGDPVKLIEPPAGLALFYPLRQRGNTLWQPEPDTITMFGRESATGSNVVARLSLKSDAPRILWKGERAPAIVGGSADQTQLIEIYGDRNTPTDIYRISPDFSKRDRITDLEPQLGGIKFGPVETFQTQVNRLDGGGSEVTSTIELPPGARRGDKLPTIVVVYPRSMAMGAGAMRSYGGGDAGEIPASLYTTRGYAVLYTQAPIRPLGQPGDIIADILSVIEPQVRHAIELGYTDADRIAVTGHSFGGYSTAALLSATNLFHVGVANAGSYDLAYWNAAMGPEGNYFSELGKIQTYLNIRGNLWEDQQRYIDASPFFRADRIKAPLLLVNGTNDNVCSIEDARLMFNALRQLGKTAQLAEYAGEGHFFNSWSQANITDASKRILAFLDKYLAAPKAASR